MTYAQRYASVYCTAVLLAWMTSCGVLQAYEYVELISSFEKEVDAFMFTYDANDKDWAKSCRRQLEKIGPFWGRIVRGPVRYDWLVGPA